MTTRKVRPRYRTDRTGTYTVVSMLTLGFVGVAAILGTLAWAAWHGSEFHPATAESVRQRASEDLLTAVDDADYARAIAIYETTHHVALGPDADLTGGGFNNQRLSSDVRLALGKAYESVGATDKAAEQYLSVLGWTGGQYDAFCALAGGCQNTDELRTLTLSSIVSQ